jgi:hypothetical protein
MSALRGVLSACLVALAAAACSSTTPANSPPDAGYCEANGYASPIAGKCARGTCATTGTDVSCCGSLCATCESKGLVSYDEAGACPNGLCPSADVTATLQCCDVCTPINADAGADGGAEGGSDAGPG